MMMRVIRFAAGAVALLAIFGALVALGLLAAGRGGVRAYAMQTSSMAPLIKPGDLVVVRAVDPYTIHTGDVISFESPLSRLQVTHRVVKVTYTPQGPAFETKGDANGSADPWVLHYQGSGWKVATVVPGVAAWLAKLTSPAGRIVVAAALFLVVFVLLLPKASDSEERTALHSVA
jgi:signal peptidase